MKGKKSNDAARGAMYVVLSFTFVSIFAVFNLLFTQRRKDVELKPFELGMLGLSVYRLGRMVAYDRVMETYRSAFTKTVPDPSGAGETTEPKGRSGAQVALGELLSCPICSGTWIAAALVYALALVPRPARVFLYITSAIGLGELLNAVTEALSWFGQAARDEAGILEGGARRPYPPSPRAHYT